MPAAHGKEKVYGLTPYGGSISERFFVNVIDSMTPGIAPELPLATTGEQIGPGLTCGNGLRTFSGEFTALPMVGQVCRRPPVGWLGGVRLR